jgi:hypothetical protein
MIERSWMRLLDSAGFFVRQSKIENPKSKMVGIVALVVTLTLYGAVVHAQTLPDVDIGCNF